MSSHRSLGGLAFLDLAQNHIQEMTRADLGGLTSLTALNLERNVIQKLDDDIFREVNRSLSSVSLLNNLLTKYPEGAITSLKDLRVSRPLLYNQV
jgi:Leucine-rich repeat (LRR) protein